MRIMISKFGNWEYQDYQESMHPEVVAIRNMISKNPQHNFVLFADGTSYEYFKANQSCFYNVQVNTKISRVFSFFLAFELALLLRVSVIVSMGTINLIPFGVSSILTRTRFIPVVTGEIWYGMKEMLSPLRKIFAFLLKIAFQKSYAILALGKSIKKELVNDYKINPEKVFIYNYKISKMFHPDVPKNLKPLLNPNGPIVLTVCRISPEKGLHYLIEASRIITEKIPNAKIIIKGPSSQEKYKEKLRNLIHKYNLREHITILNYSPYPEIPKFMSAADVFVLPSISEALGMVILEALATGVPVVASRVGGIPSILKNGYNGLLVEPRDVEGLAEAIVRTLSNDKLKKRLVKGGLTTIRRIKKNEIEQLLSKFIFEQQGGK